MSNHKEKESNKPVAKEVSDSAAAAESAILLLYALNDETQLNGLWAKRHALIGHDMDWPELVVSEREMNRTTWELSLVHLGYPKLRFETSARTLKLDKNLLTDLRLSLNTPIGMNARQAVRIEQSDASAGKVLEVTLGLNSSHIEYHKWKGSEAVVHWEQPATYVIANDRLSADRFKEHFEPLKRMKVATLSKPVSVALDDVWVYFECDQSRIRVNVFNGPGQVAAQSDPILVPASEDVAIAFEVGAFPITLTQLPPVDKDWVVGLFAPSWSMKWTLGGYIPPGNFYFAVYALSGSEMAQSKVSTLAQALKCSPLISFCDYGGDLEEIS